MKTKEHGLLAIGELRNDKAYRLELDMLVEKGFSEKLINDIVDSATKEYCNGDGRKKNPNGEPVDYYSAKYIVFKMENCFTALGEQIYGWFYRRNLNEEFVGVKWGTNKDFCRNVEINKEYKLDTIIFDTFEDSYNLLKEIDETLKLDGKEPIIDFSKFCFILNKKTSTFFPGQKVIPNNNEYFLSKDGEYIMFDIGLGKNIMLFGKIRWNNGKVHIYNPIVAKKEIQSRLFK